MAVFRRFYRMRPLAALLLCLPGALLCIWYAWNAYASLDRYRRCIREPASLTAEDFQLALFDLLSRDLRRMFMPPPPAKSKIEQFNFHIGTNGLNVLAASVHKESKRPYVPARLERGALLQDLMLRLRGHQPWHVLGKKKSLKVKLAKGELLDGQRVFNLVNEPQALLVGEDVILDILRQHAVLTPAYSFARVRINGSQLGVFHYQAQPDEGVLRLNRRMPGSMYSGNLPRSAKTDELWSDTRRWKKVAWRNDQEQKDNSELEHLLDNIRSASLRGFDEFARQEIDMRAFATFDAVDVIFGVETHDFRHNQKLYYDPYKGRWEPVAWDFRGFHHEPFFDLVENPLLLRLKMVPGYLSLRNRILYDLLVSDCSVTAVRERSMKIIKKLAPELAADPYWEAYKLLPRVDRFQRLMMRPMNLRRLALVFESEMTTYSRRHAFLVTELQKNPLWLLLGKGAQATTAVHLLLDGRAGVRLLGFRALWPDQCKDSTWQVLKEGIQISAAVSGDYAELNQPLELYPGVKLVPRKNPGRSRGTVRTETVPVSYPFLIRSSCSPIRVEAEGVQLATGSHIRSRPATPEVIQRLPERTLDPDDVPHLGAGEVSTHPWKLQAPEPKSFRLGPGTVEIAQSRVFGPRQSVSIAAGTIMRMAAGASLFFYGPVDFQGSARDPIIILPASRKPWGGIAIQGSATAGSRLVHLEARGGSLPRNGRVPYPGMLNIHDTKDIEIGGCRFADNHESDDVLHLAYVDNLDVHDTRIEDAASDAFDFEFVSGRLARVQVRRTHDEGIDLMGSRVELVDSVLLGCTGNGISAGEKTELQVRGSLVADSSVGVLAKNASRVQLSNSLLYGNGIGVRVYRRDVRFEGESKVTSDLLFVVKSNRAVERDDRSQDSLDVGMIQRRLPQAGILDHLAGDVLALRSWKELPVWLETNLKKEQP